MSILNKAVTLKINRNWICLRAERPQKVFIDMAKDTVRGINIEYAQLEDGTIDYSNPTLVEPVTFEQWLALPIRPQDSFVTTAKQKVRVPTVVVCTNYRAVPLKRLKCTAKNVAIRDNGQCQYTGKKLKPDEMSLDHVLPRSKGGKTTWNNIVLCDKRVNHMKADKTMEEAGLKLLKQPKEPLMVSAVALIKESAHSDWNLFLIK